MRMGPLEGVRVIDLSRLAPGPYCSMLLGDLGADVVRVDKPGDDPRVLDMLSRNKRSLVLDLKRAEAQQVLHRLCESADVFLEGFRPGVTARLGADYETISRVNPRIVYCSITGYGQGGPLAQEAGHDIDYIALAGVLSQLQTGEGPPLPPLNLVADSTAPHRSWPCTS
jgi:alpha-methylacyl-CoA racemase